MKLTKKYYNRLIAGIHRTSRDPEEFARRVEAEIPEKNMAYHDALREFKEVLYQLARYTKGEKLDGMELFIINKKK